MYNETGGLVNSNVAASKAKHAARTDGFDSVINSASAVNYVFQSWGPRVCVS
mgnify:FL=1